MKYYVRQGGAIQGPSTPEELGQRLADGGLPADAEVIEATGQSAGQLARATGWQPIGALIDHRAFRPSGPLPHTAAARYTEGYRTARFHDDCGRAIRTAGTVLGAIVALVQLSLAGLATEAATGSYGERSGVLGLLSVAACLQGVAVWFTFFVVGLLVSGQARVLAATLDAAVHTSPFLTRGEQAAVLGVADGTNAP